MKKKSNGNDKSKLLRRTRKNSHIKENFKLENSMNCTIVRVVMVCACVLVSVAACELIKLCIQKSANPVMNLK